MFGQSLLSAFGSAACTTDTDQLFATDVQTTSVATYQLNNATTSIPNNTYPGTASNITYAAGKFGNAAVFNGSSSYINLGTSSALNTFGGEQSISVWIKPTTSTHQEIIGYRNDSTLQWNYLEKMSNNTIRFLLRQSSSPLTVFNTTGTVTLNQWNHIVVTVNSTTAKIYINNGTAETSASTVTSFSNSETTRIGYFDSLQGVNYFNGSIDQLRIFNTALPQSAVTALYNETTTTATYPYVTTEVANPNSIAYYKMSNATDQLGNYNGTATNVNFNTEGKFGFAGAFNGGASYLNLNSAVLPASVFSVSMWINLNSLSTGWLFSQYTGSVTGRFVFNVTSTGGFQINVSSTNSLSTTNIPVITTNNWHHVVVVKDGSNGWTLYADGASHSTWNNTANIITNQNTILGGDDVVTSPNMVGKIDQVRIYDSALSAANVTALYNEIECPSVAVTNAFNTVLYTGDATARSITTVGFKPDFVWMKNRNSTQWHGLYDSVRGAGKWITSNATNAEADTAGTTLTSFNTDGFSLGNDSNGYGANTNNNTYVAWNWKAPLANLSTGFNGSSSGITSSSLGTALNVSSLSFSLWFKTNLNDSTDRILISSYDGSGNARFYASLLNSGLSVVIYGSSSTYIQNFINTVTTETWYHLSVTHTGTTTTVYLNGTAITPSSTTGSPVAIKIAGSPQPLTMGQLQGNIGTYDFNGSLDQVRIFDNALSSSEVTTLYGEPAASNNTLNYPAGAGCIAAYPLQTDAVDLSGNYNGASSNVTFGQPGYLTQNTDGTITSTVAANVDAGFSIVKYTGSGSGAVTVGHGLDVAPEMYIVKSLSTGNWWTYHSGLNGGVNPSHYFIRLDLSNAESFNASSGGSIFNSTEPTSTVFSGGTTINGAENFIAYCFTSIPGYSKVGSYTGNGNNAGTIVYTGFTPSWVMIKSSSTNDNGGGAWIIYDNKRSTSNPRDKRLYPNVSSAELTNSNYDLNFLNEGFQPLNGASGGWGFNTLNVDYIFLAIA